MWESLGFQNILSPVSSFLESLHDVVMVWLTVVLILVLFISFKVLLGLKSWLYPDSLVLEVVWTILPVFILLLIALPSLQLLCVQDSISRAPLITLKTISNQWNWQSEGQETLDHLLDSDLLDVTTAYDSPMTVLSAAEIRVLTVSTDVLHSLGLPSLAIKLDTAPGRINTTVMESTSPSLLLGSCYELCGSGHSAMPFALLAL